MALIGCWTGIIFAFHRPRNNTKQQHRLFSIINLQPMKTTSFSSLVFILASAVCGLPTGASAASGDEHWDYQFGMPGADDAVQVIANYGGDTNAGGTMVSCIARWDGASWTSLGSGLARLALGGTGPIAGTGAALVFNGNDLYAGGMFVTAGGKVSSGIARWNGQTTFTLPAVMCLNRPCLGPGGQFQFRVTAGSDVNYVIEGSTDLAIWQPLVTNSASPFIWLDSDFSNHAYRFYRARQAQ